MAVSEVRTQIYLERSQHEALKRLATRRAISMAQVVREAITNYLASPKSTGGRSMEPEDPALTFLEAVRDIGGSGKRDTASRIDEELYGPIET